MRSDIDLPPGQLPGEPRCPRCRHILNGYAVMNAPEETRMREGDVTVCAACSCIAIRTESGFRRSTPKELAALSPAERDVLTTAILTLREARQRMGAGHG